MYKVLKKLGLPKEPIFDDELIDLDWSTIAGTAQRYLGLNLFLNFYISEDVRNTSRNRMMMEQVSPGFSERYLLDPIRFESELTEYKHYVKSMVELAGVGDKSASFANEILNISTKIAKIMETLEERRSSNHLLHDVSIDELQQLTDLHAVKVKKKSFLIYIFSN